MRDLELVVDERPDGWELALAYRRSAYSRGLAERWLERYRELLEAIVTGRVAAVTS